MINSILITGIGGDIGYGISKIVKEEGATHIYGTDIHDFHCGYKTCEKCFIVPSVTGENYIEEMQKIINENEIEILIPGSHIEIEYFQTNNIQFENVKIIMCDNNTFLTFNDKYLTYQFLKNNNLPFPKTFKINEININDIKLPCVLKKSMSRGNKNVFIIQDNEELIYFYNKYKNDIYIIQEYIDCDDEYTCCIFRTTNINKHIIIKRELENGITKRGIIINNKIISDLLTNISNKINLNGSINVQLRFKNEIPYIFEINPRFSSTLVFRHMLNFKDVIWSIYDKLNIPIIDDILANENKRFFMLYEQYILT